MVCIYAVHTFQFAMILFAQAYEVEIQNKLFCFDYVLYC